MKRKKREAGEIMKRKRLFLAIGLIGIAILITACGGSGNGNPTPTPIPQLVNYDNAIFTVERGPIVEETRLIGNIVPTKQDDLFFRSSGFVTRVAFKEGESFKQGDILAELQVDDLLNQLEQSRIDLEVSQANLADYNVQQEYNLQKAESEVKIWEKRVELAELTLDSASGTNNKQRAQIDLDITNENLLLAKQALQLLKDESNPYLEQAVKRSQLAVQRLESLIQERQITAPYDGIVLKSSIRAGQQIDAFETAFKIGDPTNMIISVPYDYELATTLNEETPVYFYLNADDEEGLPVKYVTGFQPERGEQNVNQAVTTDNLYFSLPEGLTADQIPSGRNYIMQVILGQKEDALLLAPAAIREYKGLNFVIVLDGERRRRAEIYEIGLKSPDRWEIVGDLEEGDQVLGP
jgi:HlyD family secretion protein